MDIDPTLAAMGARLAELAIRNTSAAVYTKVQAITTGKIDQQTVNGLRGIIDDLLAENADLLSITRAYEEQLVSQRISDKDIRYIIETVVPALKKLAAQSADNATTDAEKEVARGMETALEILSPLLSVEALTVLQLVGFNFTKAIGEPLTLLMQRLITAQARPDPQSVLEINRLSAEGNLAMLNIAQDEAAVERFKQVLCIWRSNDAAG